MENKYGSDDGTPQSASFLFYQLFIHEQHTWGFNLPSSWPSSPCSGQSRTSETSGENRDYVILSRSLLHLGHKITSIS